MSFRKIKEFIFQKVNEIKISDHLDKHYDVKFVASGNKKKACCPFHNEKTPSFYVSDAKNIFKCFGCEEGGHGAVGFEMKKNRLEFITAVERVAMLNGIAVEYEFVSEEEHKKYQHQIANYELMKQVQERFQKCLATHDDFKKYIVNSRGITLENAFVYGFGAMTNSFSLGMDEFTEQLTQVKVLNAKGNVALKNRITYSLTNRQGNIIAFSGRINPQTEAKNEKEISELTLEISSLKVEIERNNAENNTEENTAIETAIKLKNDRISILKAIPKYKHTETNDLFQKTNFLYNFSNAYNAIAASKIVYCFEGVWDVLLPRQAGILNCVASLGADYSDEQLTMLRNCGAVHIILCLDPDMYGFERKKDEQTGKPTEAYIIENGKLKPKAVIRNAKRMIDAGFQVSVKIMDRYNSKKPDMADYLNYRNVAERHHIAIDEKTNTDIVLMEEFIEKIQPITATDFNNIPKLDIIEHIFNEASQAIGKYAFLYSEFIIDTFSLIAQISENINKKGGMSLDSHYLAIAETFHKNIEIKKTKTEIKSLLKARRTILIEEKNKKDERYFDSTPFDQAIMQFGDSKSFFWIGQDLYHYIPDGKGSIVLEKYNQSSYKSQYDNGKEMLQQILKFIGQRYKPLFFQDYQRIIEEYVYGKDSKFINLFHETPLKSLPVEVCDFQNIKKVLKHLFYNHNGKTEHERWKYYHFIMECLHLRYTQPHKRLPSIVLVSPGREAGKSSFKEILKLLFGKNVLTINQADIETKFNAEWIRSYIIAAEEIRLQDKKTMDMLKIVTTDPEARGEAKGANRASFDNFMWWVITSNHDTSALRLDPEEVRYFVWKVPPIEDEERIGDFHSVIPPEIPHFARYVINDVKYRYSDNAQSYRLSFPFEDYRTVYFEKMVSFYQKPIINLLHNLLQTWFNDLPDEDDLVMEISTLQNVLESYSNKYKDAFKQGWGITLRDDIAQYLYVLNDDGTRRKLVNIELEPGSNRTKRKITHKSIKFEYKHELQRFCPNVVTYVKGVSNRWIFFNRKSIMGDEADIAQIAAKAETNRQTEDDLDLTEGSDAPY